MYECQPLSRFVHMAGPADLTARSRRGQAGRLTNSLANTRSDSNEKNQLNARMVLGLQSDLFTIRPASLESAGKPAGVDKWSVG